SRQVPDARRRDAGLGLGPLWRVQARVPRQVLEADCMTLYELAVVEGLGDDDVHHRQCERRVGAGTDDEGLVGLPEGFGAADVDRDHAGTPAAGGVKAWARVGLARQVGAPEQYQLGV